MGFFKKLFAQGDKTPRQEEPKPQPQQTLAPCKSEQELLERYGALALEKQLHLGEVIGNSNWNADMQKGEISFGPNLHFPIQVLGTFSHSSETWLWAWANTQSGLPENLRQHALHLKNYGEENEIALLKVSEFDATKDDLHLIGLTASGMFNASGYYLADYGQGTMVVTVKSDTVDSLRKEDHQRILTVFPQLISQFGMNHKQALKNYLAAKGYAITVNENDLTATKNGNTLAAEFDDNGRLSKLHG